MFREVEAEVAVWILSVGTALGSCSPEVLMRLI